MPSSFLLPSPSPTVASHQPDELRARHVVACSGIPEHVVRALDELEYDDWRRLAALTSAVFTITGNEMAQQAFWATESDHLDGLTPLQTLARPDGTDRVSRYARRWRCDRRRARRVPQPA